MQLNDNHCWPLLVNNVFQISSKCVATHLLLICFRYMKLLFEIYHCFVVRQNSSSCVSKAFYASNKTGVNDRTEYSLKIHLWQHCYFFPALLTCSLYNPCSLLTHKIQTLQNYYWLDQWVTTKNDLFCLVNLTNKNRGVAGNWHVKTVQTHPERGDPICVPSEL